MSERGAAPCAWEAVGSGTACGVDGQVALGGRGAGAGHAVAPRRSPALGRWLACGPVSETRVVTRGAGPAQHVLRKFVLHRFWGGPFWGQGFEDMSALSCVMLGGDGGYKTKCL